MDSDISPTPKKGTTWVRLSDMRGILVLRELREIGVRSKGKVKAWELSTFDLTPSAPCRTHSPSVCRSCSLGSRTRSPAREHVHPAAACRIFARREDSRS